ncbi:MAG TPA: tRNA (adenosine(37)-N6)-threonylcarbamoyltransferase complex ATPase subunit type 1 TsaE, partial [Candidatus Limnocylindria bacterium]|nr:tRNA (adenosine(37)-N6)-threonylcarbamoyltransferase complex ATPase subunit type 1 TsaE [Candidatus Limnocylindria bacterium]
YSLDEIDKVVLFLRSQLDRCQVYTFSGVLGAGKTTLIQQLLQASGVQDPVTSPTFTYVNIYENKLGQTFYHFDCYRIASVDSFLEAGFGEYLYAPNSWAFIEWPQVVMPLLYQNVCHVKIDYYEGNKRELICTIIGQRQGRPEISFMQTDQD